MTRRFWAGVMLISLVASGGATAYMYKMLMDKSTVTVPLKQVGKTPFKTTAVAEPVSKPSEPVDPPPVPEKPEELRNIQFAYTSATAKEVFIVGTFTNDKNEPLTKNGKKWTINLKLKPGIYEYLYVVNGKKVKDPFNKKVSNGKSVITIAAKPAKAN